jgi:hypothetical protein
LEIFWPSKIPAAVEQRGTSTSRSTATLVPGTKLQRVEADLHIAK